MAVEPSIYEFSAKFCNALDKMKNCAFSPPAAAELTMAMMALGSFDPAGPMFSNYIQINDGSIIPSSFLLLASTLKSIKGVTLKCPKKVYLKKGYYKVNQNLKKDAIDTFGVKIEEIDFSKSDDTFKRINKWVEKKTKKNIKNFFHWSSFRIDTNIVLVSGVYFKGIWHMKFDPENTEETIFYLNNNETVNVFLMYRKEKYRYKDNKYLDAQLVLLPFKNEEAHMLIVLPNQMTGLDGMLQKLADGYDFTSDLSEMSENVEVAVNIPRFKIESEINLNEVLHKLNINTKFDKAVQKVLIEVNEAGTEPKPEQMKSGFIPRWKPKPKVFTADHPHLIVILCHNIPIIWVTFRGRFE